MVIERIQVRNFRLYSTAVLPCSSGLNLLWGPNGAGKTTLLEAICVAAWGKAFDSSDAALLRQGSSHYWVRLDAHADIGVPYWVEVEYAPEQGKRIRSIYKNTVTPRELVGVIPIVLLTPGLKSITAGAPHERRRFLDMVLSQCSRPYLELLLEHRRTLRQRNSLLQRHQMEANFSAQWQSWTELFVQMSAQLIWRRWSFIQEFEPLAQDHHRRIAPAEHIQLRYLPDGVPSGCLERGVEDICSCLQQRAREVEAEELRRGMTLFGPQKDELLVLLNGMVARETASQGQHKSLLLSLKLAELLYIRQHHGETPVMLLDDVFGELDEMRAQAVVNILEAYGVQTFITATDPYRLPGDIPQRVHSIRVGTELLVPAS